MRIKVDCFFNPYYPDYNSPEHYIWTLEINYIPPYWLLFYIGPEFFDFVTKPTKRQIRRCIKEFKKARR